jgi:hypothetical protein
VWRKIQRRTERQIWLCAPSSSSSAKMPVAAITVAASAPLSSAGRAQLGAAAAAAGLGVRAAGDAAGAASPLTAAMAAASSGVTPLYGDFAGDLAGV